MKRKIFLSLVVSASRNQLKGHLMERDLEDICAHFCRTIRRRSEDHAAAAELVANIPSQMISILRQELDSLIRVVYLLSIPDLSIRNGLMKRNSANLS